MSYPNEVTITEVCPRDGFQSLSEVIPTEEKVEYINRLIDCGFRQIEVTSFVHPKAIPQLSDASAVLTKIKRVQGVKLRALVPNVKGMERAIAANVDKVKLMLSATDSHSLSNANTTTFEAMKAFESLVKSAEDSLVQIGGSISVAFGCPYEGNVPIERHLEICRRYEELGIKDISLADTTGMANPVKIKTVVSTLKSQFPDFHFSLHLHNTRGMAFANAVAGLETGIKDFDSSAAGLGGCPYAPNASGNIATEDLVHGFEEMGIRTGIQLDNVMKIGSELKERFPDESNSFILKAGKCSDLSRSPNEQVKIGE
ncbi:MULTISPECIES: hydroxymethylglutaryl-CoA lyase [unclassified Cytobacillus]|uniref:hydroxymethylglutaryl-CoA lyase n=1 Tax=unclassified Cytobacillus TaxID=2675268 RepID=UPI00135840F4|nr:hydroxymethylglutaryl-CoA lyase [Cytobacillus sp. AMY 15.2]KAF0818536.1 Pyruvate:Oxaloacetate transcarboxylase domain protein [Bacillus sp. ZZV12-4809]MCM3093059.1 hydroxymethylglutaryl-CoA lyase [Cytobacillus sp. AMY 15.2]